ncbi:MAG: hypothetical protein CL869_00335 [Cytophagia bacterium]|nr:hypothetical protein [Cytophagia bacterium]
MRYLLLIIFSTISFLHSQCDANDDDILNILDVLVQVDCILNDCWQDFDYNQLIIGSWVLDSTYYSNVWDEGQTYCGDNGYYSNKGLIFTFENNGDLLLNEMDPEYCEMDEVVISDSDYYYNNPPFWDYYYTVNQDILNLGFSTFNILTLNQNNLIIYQNSETDGEMTMYFHKVTVVGNFLENLDTKTIPPIKFFNNIIK